MPYLIAEPSLAEKELGFQAPQDLDAMCQDLWNWQTKNPDGYEGDSVVDAPKTNGIVNVKSCITSTMETISTEVIPSKINGHTH